MTEDEELENTFRLMKKETDFQKVMKYVDQQTDIAADEARKLARTKALQEKGWTEDEYYLAYGKDCILGSSNYGLPRGCGVTSEPPPKWWQLWKMIKISRHGF